MIDKIHALFLSTDHSAFSHIIYQPLMGHLRLGASACVPFRIRYITMTMFISIFNVCRVIVMSRLFMC